MDAPPIAPTRRRFLTATATAAGGALAGCTTGTAGPGSAGASGGQEREAVSLLAAGSLQLALSQGLTAAVDVPLEIEAHGSATVARLVATDRRQPDVVSVADTALFESILDPAWYAVFASNAVVLAYNPETAGGRRVAEAGPDAWYRPLLEGTVSLGRTDPDQDPLGYRTLFALELATRYYDDVPALHEAVPDRRQLYPETSLLSRFETGAMDAAFVYRNMAVERGYDYVPLPSEIDLSDPALVEDWYRTVAYTLPDGTTVQGDLIRYGSTIRQRGTAVDGVFDAHVAGDYLAEHGFVTPTSFPRFEGDVPDGLAG
jgi:molybdate/tungstate transport system substrate-binding protein